MPARFHRLSCSILLGVAACAVEPGPGTAPGDLEGEIVGRERTLLADLEVGTTPADAAAFWQACIERHAPEVRAAQAAVTAAQARMKALGAPAASMLEVESTGAGKEGETEIMLALDLPGLVGAGRSGAARALATVDVEIAEAELDRARFMAGLRVRRALAGLEAERRRGDALQALNAEAVEGARRIDLLVEKGWLPPNQVAQAQTMLHHLGAALSEQQARHSERRAELAAAAGLSIHAAVLDSESTQLLSLGAWYTGSGTLVTPDRDVATLLRSHPTVRAKRLSYARGEALVRSSSAQRWPALLLGPKAVFTSDDLMLGGLLRLELPWPGTAAAEVDAAVQERAAARAALVDALVEVQAALAATLARWLRAEEIAAYHARELEQHSALAWSAARARFMTDVTLLPDWSIALEQRLTAIGAVADAWEGREMATLDHAQAAGPDPESAREEGAR